MSGRNGCFSEQKPIASDCGIVIAWGGIRLSKKGEMHFSCMFANPEDSGLPLPSCVPCLELGVLCSLDMLDDKTL
jgi:hypothetical protein